MEVEDTLPVPRLVRKNTSVTTPGLPKEIYATKLHEMLGLDDIRDLNLTEVQNSENDHMYSQMPQDVLDEQFNNRQRSRFGDLYD